MKKKYSFDNFHTNASIENEYFSIVILLTVWMNVY